MSALHQQHEHYQAVRARLMNPPNAVEEPTPARPRLIEPIDIRAMLQHRKSELERRRSLRVEIRRRHKLAKLESRIETARGLEIEDGAKYRPSARLPKDVARIVYRLCRTFKITPEKLLGDEYPIKLSIARQAVYYWSIRTTAHSLPELGEMFGGRHHTSLIYGARTYVEKRAYMKRSLPQKATKRKRFPARKPA